MIFKVDVVLLRENLLGKRPAYVFADAGVETRMTAAKTHSTAILDHNEQNTSPKRDNNRGRNGRL